MSGERVVERTTAVDLREQKVLVAPPPRHVRQRRGIGDRIFRSLAVAAGMSTLVIIAAIAAFLLYRAWPVLRDQGLSFFTRFEWDPYYLDPVTGLEAPRFGIAAMIFGTVLMAALALLMAVPVAIGTSVFINEYAPRRLVKALTGFVDLLAAIPSLIYGLWGAFFLVPRMAGLGRFLSDHLSFIPIFDTQVAIYEFSYFDASVVLALMILPIIASVTRAVLAQVPRANTEAALALGGSRWGMVRRVVLPHGRSGIVGAGMLGLARAMGETIAVTLILGLAFDINFRILQPSGGSVAALIVNNFGEALPTEVRALVGAGLALFVLTLVVNMAARMIVNRAVATRGLDL